VEHRSVKPNKKFYGVFKNHQEYFSARGLSLDESPIVCYKFKIEEVILNSKGGELGE
jgi:hypothetical protein